MGEDRDRIRDGLTAAVGGAGTGRTIAEQLCAACIDLLDVHGAGLWLMTTGAAGRSVSTCGAMPEALDRLQLSTGEGPCWDAVRSSTLVTAPDLRGADVDRWPTFCPAAAELGIQSVFAVPVTSAGVPMGVLYLCRSWPGPLTGPALAGTFLAAELAALPLLDVIADTRAGHPLPRSWTDFGSLTRSEVYQAVGMITAQLRVHPGEAMLRLRGYAYANDLTASQVAFLIIDRSLELEDDGTGTGGRPDLGEWPEPGGGPDEQ